MTSRHSQTDWTKSGVPFAVAEHVPLRIDLLQLVRQPRDVGRSYGLQFFLDFCVDVFHYTVGGKLRICQSAVICADNVIGSNGLGITSSAP